MKNLLDGTAQKTGMSDAVGVGVAGVRGISRPRAAAVIDHYLTSLTLWLSGVGSLLFLAYWLASPMIFLNGTNNPAASPLLRQMSGPVIHVLESDFRGPLLWYFGLWGIEIDYFAVEPMPKPPWYVGPTYFLVSALCLAALVSPLSRWWLGNSRGTRKQRGKLQHENPVTSWPVHSGHLAVASPPVSEAVARRAAHKVELRNTKLNNTKRWLILALLTQSCVSVLAQTDEVQATVFGNAKFAFALYAQVAQEASGNVFVSPWSVTCGLVAARIGADGETASEISRAACLPSSNDPLLRGFGAVNERVQHLEEGTGVTLRRVTGIWRRSDQPLLEDFAVACRLAIGAKVLDGGLNSQAINHWVSEQTMGRIQDLLGPEDLRSLSRLVLVDALYFKARWERQFAAGATRPARFTLVSGRTVEVPMMNGEQSAGYCFYQSARVLQLPYEGGAAVMLLILPVETNGLAALERELSVEWLNGIRKVLRPSTVEVSLPRFTVSQGLKLKPALRRLGMVRAFTGDADFSRIDGSRTNLFIDEVLQKAYVEVSEQGTEAAVATGAHWTTRSAAIVESFVCDRPFLFMIYAAKAGTILFMGRMTDPTVARSALPEL